MTHLGLAERNVSVVFQSYALFRHLDVLANAMPFDPAQSATHRLIVHAGAVARQRQAAF